MLKPGGCFAAWMYGLPTLCHKGHPANEVMWHLYDTVLGGHWAAGRKHVEAEYVGIEPVIGQDFSTVERFSFETTRTAHVNDVVRVACLTWCSCADAELRMWHEIVCIQHASIWHSCLYSCVTFCCMFIPFSVKLHPKPAGM